MSQPPPLPQTDLSYSNESNESTGCPPEIPVKHSYEGRISILEKTRVYEVDATSLGVTDELGRQSYALCDVTEVRCRFFPTRFQANRYETLLTIRNGLRLKICNQFYLGIADFEDRSQPYRDFITTLHARIIANQPSCIYSSGSSPAGYWLNAIFLGGIMLLLLALGILMFTSIPMISIVKLAIFAFFLPRAWSWFKKNKPRRYDPRQIPADVLP